MTVEHIIKALEKLDPQKHIIMPMWTKEDFPNVVSNETHWRRACTYVESVECWDDITVQLEQVIKKHLQPNPVAVEKKIAQETK
jgi:hypothetical protein